MKKRSDQLREEAHQSENDLAFFAKIEQAEKEEKRENFREQDWPTVQASPKISFATDHGHFFKIGFKDGVIVDYYPGKNRLFQTKPAQWFYDGRNILMSMVKETQLDKACNIAKHLYHMKNKLVFYDYNDQIWMTGVMEEQMWLCKLHADGDRFVTWCKISENTVLVIGKQLKVPDEPTI